MKQYRIVLLDGLGAELSAGYVFAASDESACASAERLMKSSPKAAEVRVLREGQLVCSYEQAA